jgi:hypothetical protein
MTINENQRKPETIEEMADALIVCINNNTKESIRQSIINGFNYLLNKPKSNAVNEPVTDKEIDAEIERYIKQFWPRPEHGGAVRLGFKRAVRWMQERQSNTTEPIVDNELLSSIVKSVLCLRDDADVNEMDLSIIFNQIKQISKQYAASKLNNTIEDEWLDTKPEFNKECVFITATKYNRNSEDLEYDYACWQIKKLDGEDENGNPAWYFGLLNGDGEEWGALEDLRADYYLIIPEVGK